MPSTQTDRLKGLTTSVAVKAAVLVASTGNLSLSSTQVIDGVAVSSDDRVLAKNQTTTSENGIYVVDTGDWTRATDFDGSRDVVRGTSVYVAAGSANGDRWFRVSSTGDNVPGTDNITFTQAAGLTTTTQLTGALDTNDNAINESEATAVASNSTTNIWAADGNTVHITGTTTITSLSTAPRIGAIRKVIFDGALTLTHDSTNLILPGSQNITTVAGDAAFFYADSTSAIRCINFQPVNNREISAIQTVSSNGAVVSGSGISIVSTDSTSGITLTISAPAAGTRKEIHFQTSATALSLDSSATTILFQNSSAAVAAATGSTTLSVSSSAVGIAGSVVLRGLSTTIWAVMDRSAFLTISS